MLDDAGGEGLEAFGVLEQRLGGWIESEVLEFDPCVAFDRGIKLWDGEAAFQERFVGVGAESKLW